jgi:hypothetical protein
MSASLTKDDKDDPVAAPRRGRHQVRSQEPRFAAGAQGHRWIGVDGSLVGSRRSGDKLYELREILILRQRTRTGFVLQSFSLFPPRRSTPSWLVKSSTSSRIWPTGAPR